MMLVKPLMTNLKMTIRDDCAVLLVTPILSIKALIPCLSGVGGELAFGQMSTMLPPQLLASEIKQPFLPPTWPVYWLLRSHTLSVTPMLVRFIETEWWVLEFEEKEGEELLWKGTEFQFGKRKTFWRWEMMMVAQQSECTQFNWILHLEMVKFMLYILQ